MRSPRLRLEISYWWFLLAMEAEFAAPRLRPTMEAMVLLGVTWAVISHDSPVQLAIVSFWQTVLALVYGAVSVLVMTVVGRWRRAHQTLGS